MGASLTLSTRSLPQPPVASSTEPHNTHPPPHVGTLRCTAKGEADQRNAASTSRSAYTAQHNAPNSSSTQLADTIQPLSLHCTHNPKTICHPLTALFHSSHTPTTLCLSLSLSLSHLLPY